MMSRASIASSRVVTLVPGSGSPFELVNTDFCKPISRARCVIWTAKSASVPAMPSASTMQASLPDWMIMPCSRSSTGTLLLSAANIVEVCEGAPPLRQAFSLTLYSSVRLTLPSFMRWKTYSAVISLARLAGKISLSGSRSYSSPPFSASIRIACGALMTGSSLLRGGSFFAATAAGLADFTSCLMSCLGAAKAHVPRPASKAAAARDRPNALNRNSIVQRSNGRAGTLPGGIIGADVAKICGSVKAAAAHEAGGGIAANRRIGGNRRNPRFFRGFLCGFLHEWRGGLRMGSSDARLRRGTRRDLTGTLTQPVRAVGRGRNTRIYHRAAIEISRRVTAGRGHLHHRQFAWRTLAQCGFKFAVVGTGDRRTADIVHFHLGDAVAVEAQELGGAHRDVDHAVADIGPAVIDTHNDRFVIGEIGNAHIRGQWQRRMRGRQRIHVEDFAVSSVTAMEIVTIPGGQAHGAVVGVFMRHVFAVSYTHLRAHETGRNLVCR